MNEFKIGLKLLVKVNATKDNLKKLGSLVQGRLEAVGLDGRVNLLHNEIHFVDHGQNPLQERDMMSYFSVIDIKSTNPYKGYGSAQGMPFPTRFGINDAEAHVDALIKDIEKYEGVNV